MPAFCDRFVNTLASDDNPTKRGMYVETIHRRRGHINAGEWWRLTDGQGRFWEVEPSNLVPLSEEH